MFNANVLNFRSTLKEFGAVLEDEKRRQFSKNSLWTEGIETMSDLEICASIAAKLIIYFVEYRNENTIQKRFE